MSNFHPLEVVGRGSETQLQVGENLNYLILRLKGEKKHLVPSRPPTTPGE